MEISKLKPFAEFAAAHIHLLDATARQEAAMQGFHGIQQILKEEFSTKSLEVIMEAAKQAGFDRIRYFDYYPNSQEFVCTAMKGTFLGDLRGKKIDVRKRPVAKHIVASAPFDASARIYGPNQPQWYVNSRKDDYLPELERRDPDAELLFKDPDRPWAVVPILFGGELYGQLAADNATHKREINRDSLNYLTLLGALLSQLRGLERLALMTALPSFESLTRYTTFSGPRERLIQQLLIYLTCGESLGFSRALLYEPETTSGRMRLTACLGSLNPERHAYVANIAKTLGVAALLQRYAGDMDDKDLYNELEDVSFIYGDSSDPLVQANSPGIGPEFLKRISSKIQADYIFLVKLRHEGRLLGLLMVDRKWQQSNEEPKDRERLKSFSTFFSRILVAVQPTPISLP